MVRVENMKRNGTNNEEEEILKECIYHTSILGKYEQYKTQCFRRATVMKWLVTVHQRLDNIKNITTLNNIAGKPTVSAGLLHRTSENTSYPRQASLHEFCRISGITILLPFLY
jgi:hypothetical protein